LDVGLSFFGVILSAITLHEKLHGIQIAGGALVIIGTFLTSEYESRRLARQNRAPATASAQDQPQNIC
jgi:drug/metabolite transporter (DMT)-like permease